MSVVELNFLRKQPLRSLCVTLDGGLTSQVCTALKGSPYSRKRKECFGLNSSEGWDPDPNHSWTPSHLWRCSRSLISTQFSRNVFTWDKQRWHLCCEYTQRRPFIPQHHYCHMITCLFMLCLFYSPHSLFISMASSYLCNIFSDSFSWKQFHFISVTYSLCEH